MAKKRLRDTREPGDHEAHLPESEGAGDETEELELDMVNVEFEWFNFDPEIDSQGIRALIRQLLDVDASLLDVRAITDLIVSQTMIGSTIKVDGKANDAYAFITLLNISLLASQNQALASFKHYLGQKAATEEALAPIAKLLGATDSRSQIGLIMSERLINMPVEVAPSMYRLLMKELEDAVEDKEPYEFTHYLILSRVYREVESLIDVEEQRKKKTKGESPLLYFHVEDEGLQKHSVAHGDFHYTKADENVADSKRAFQDMGIKTTGYMILIEADKLQEAVNAIS